MIGVGRAPVPRCLDGPDSHGGKERQRAVAFYEDQANKRAKFSFKSYKRKDVIAALEAMFGGKCAYCEGYYDKSEPVDVEHFRPKAGFVCGERLEIPGYYWLAAEWSNLLPSCIDCNRGRTQEFARVPAHVSGKANKFPIADEARRAHGPGEERYEKPLLLNPCEEDPEAHLLFTDDGHVDPARDRRGRQSRKGKASIEVFGLDRDPLVRARKRVLKKLAAAIRHLEVLARQLEKHPGDSELEKALDDASYELAEFTWPEAEFAQMSRRVVQSFEERFLDVKSN
jgi:uncharacterized protein (TIGR02646 family)